MVDDSVARRGGFVVAEDPETERSSLADDDSLTPEGLEDLMERAPVAAEEQLHLVSDVDEALLDEGTDVVEEWDDDVELSEVDRPDEG